MASVLFRRGLTFMSVVNPHILTRVRSLCSRESTILEKRASVDKTRIIPSDDSCIEIHLSPLFTNARDHLDECNIEVVDSDAWQISSGLTDAWRGTDTKSSTTEFIDEAIDYSPSTENEPDFDEIEDMRIRGNLFYKLEKASKEFEEYNFEFRGKKSSKNKVDRKESKKTENPKHNSATGSEKIKEVVKNQYLPSQYQVVDISSVDEKKKQRNLTFNQLTGPYHEPFCLDIYISKSSVRACVIHRASSKVVVVAHSISKDFKFDLDSTKDLRACAAVGGVLAQRALADDIHNVIYTPRKGEKLEGKLQIVLQSIIDNGINVKVKIKQRKPKKAGHLSTV